MPADGIPHLPKTELLTFEEIMRLIRILSVLGISKVRLTGGEPFLRKDLMKLIAGIMDIPGIHDVHLTTNGILTQPHIPTLKKLGIASMNLSLDTLDRKRFQQITRRDEFDRTWRALQSILEHDIPLKINAVVMDGKNIEDIVPLAELARHHNVVVRFIEEMPFNGEGSHYPTLVWTHKKILAHLRTRYPGIEKATDGPHATAAGYTIPGFKGQVGIIASFSRTFCGTCNRIRLTAQGMLKTCLYDQGVLDIRGLLRRGAGDDDIRNALMEAFRHRPANGFEAERRRVPITESMSTIGG